MFTNSLNRAIVKLQEVDKMDEYTKQFGERVKERRKAMGLTQTDLALRMGFKSKQAISHIEAGDRNLKQSQVAALAAALGVTPAYLMGWEDSEREKMIREIHDLLDQLSDDQEQAVLTFLQAMISSK